MKIINDHPESQRYKVAAFYCFIPLRDDDIKSLKGKLSDIANEGLIKGTILLAPEGFNGTICGQPDYIDRLINVLIEGDYEGFPEIKYSWTRVQAFRRFKIKIKHEIVTMGVMGVSPNSLVGAYVKPDNWNDYLSDPETMVIDTRNKYEIGIGTFRGAINPYTDNFRQFPLWVKSFLRPFVEKNKPKRIAMFCTGGIRCEKATSYLIQEGLDSVHHLHGGILRYLEEVPEEESLWQGECFVFDQRVSLTHGLGIGNYSLCYACGMPLSVEDRKSHSYIKGVQCGHCINTYSVQDRERFSERQTQYDKLLDNK